MLGYEYSHKPELYQYTRAGKKEMAQTQSTFGQAGASTMKQSDVEHDKRMTSHWKSMTTQVNKDNLEKPVSKSDRPQWSLPREAYTSKRSYFHTENQSSFGSYGQNPRQKLNQDSSAMQNEEHELTVGTTKVTHHIPGYNGFIPKTDLNANAVEQGKCGKVRNTIIKQNIVENYSVKVPGYSGHKPMSCVNDRGAVRPSCLATTGESFQ
jgi:hypothetical protein